MKKYLSIFYFIFIAIDLFAQFECAHIKSNYKKHKSNTFSIQQIAKSQKYDVHFYSLDLSLTNQNTFIEGTVEIHATAKENLDSALIELYPSFTITEIKVNNSIVNYSRKQSVIAILVNAPTNTNFILHISYNGTPPTTETNPMGGSGLTCKLETKYNKQITSSLSEPFSAYEWWPCKQSLTDKADSCSVKITVPNNCKAGSNGLLQKIVDLGNGNSRYEWKHNHPIDYYLISVAVGEYLDYSIYAYPEEAAKPILIQNYVYDHPDFLNDWKTNIDATVDYMKLYSKLYGLYPFHNEKYGHCTAPIGGGMEHQTMTTQSNFDKNLTAHELAHQWFGNNVTCGSWADIWVNEGFATYSQYLMLEFLHPDEKFNQMEAYHKEAMKYLDGSVYISSDTLNAKRIFDYRLSYAKGAAIIHTIRYIINNDSLFFLGLKNFQNKYATKTAIAEDIKSSLEEAAGINLDNAFNEWYYGEGFPTYKIKWNTIFDDLSLEITQYGSGAFLTQRYTTPLEISFGRINQPDTLIRFDVKELVNLYSIKNIGKVNKINAVDPNNWIINKTDSIIYDPSFETFSLNTSKNSTKIAPNPTNGIVSIVTKSELLNHIKLCEPSGKLVYETDFIKEIEIDMSKMSAGIYFFQIKSANDSLEFYKIIKS